MSADTEDLGQQLTAVGAACVAHVRALLDPVLSEVPEVRARARAAVAEWDRLVQALG